MRKDIHFDTLTSKPFGEFSFLKFPKSFFYDEDLSSLSSNAKILYSLMLDRSCLSKENGWIDAKGNVYIFYSIANIMSDLNVSKPTAIAALKELDDKDGIGLIHIESQSKGRPNIINVKDISTKWTVPVNYCDLKSKDYFEPGNNSLQQPVNIIDPNKTDMNKTESKETNLNDDSEDDISIGNLEIDVAHISDRITYLFEEFADEYGSYTYPSQAYNLMISKMKCFRNGSDIAKINSLSDEFLEKIFTESMGLVTGFRKVDDIDGYMYRVIASKLNDVKPLPSNQ